MPLSNRLQPGKLRHRIKVVRPPGSQDTMGGIPQEQMTVLHDCWAQFEALGGRDQLTSDEFMSQSNYKITIRFFADVDAACRVWFNKRTFQITAVNNPDQRNKLLVLMAVEINDSRQQFATPLAGQ